MRTPVVARLWIAAAEHALDIELAEADIHVLTVARARVRASAIEAEELRSHRLTVNAVDRGRG